ncbi:hypothetical protein T06_4272 [Trichinella sp. T6]|nr:hypothetical protein T06_4272 [Trichinella sp. T6]
MLSSWSLRSVLSHHQTAGTYLVLHTEIESVLIVNNTLDRISEQDSAFCHFDIDTPTSSTNGEGGRIDGPEWARPPEILTMLLNVETCFEHMEMNFRAARIAAER